MSDEDNLILSMVEDEEEQPKRRGRPPKNSPQVVPSMSSKEWTGYVLSELDATELDDNGNPSTAGLRRIAEKLLGPIVETDVNIVQAPSQQNGMIAAVEYRLSIEWILDDAAQTPIRTFCDVADASTLNTDEPFSLYLTAIAATRAEGRALRKALKLHGVIIAEEVSKSTLAENTIDMSGAITSTQINGIDALCKRLNINVMNFINVGQTKYKKIEDVSKASAAKMMALLNTWQRDTSLIKEKVKNYDKEWRIL